MLDNLRNFARERFPLPLGLALAGILVAGPAMLRGGHPGAIVVVLLAVCAGLLALRVADDLNSVDEDRLRKPERGLPSGRINAQKLRHSLAPLTACLLLAASVGPWLTQLLLLLALILFYGGYFRWKKKLPILLRPFCANFFFFVLPFVGAQTGAMREVLLGVFCWLAAVGHEIAHNIRAPTERQAGGAVDYVDVLGVYPCIVFAALLYGGSALAGWCYIVAAGGAPVFVVCLALMLVWLLWLFLRIAQTPNMKNARAFYVAGFVFFLLPLASLVARHMVSTIKALF